jgi:hypothetical protein
VSTSGPTIETVSRKRVIPATELENEKTSRVPDFWEYIEGLKPEQWTSQNHIVYLYRQEPKTTTYPGAPPAYLDKYVGEIEVRPGYSVPMNDAGTIQQAIKDKFGGRVFRMILKRGSERLTEATFSTEAQPKYPDTTPQYAQHPLPGAAPSTDASVASKAIDAMANQQPDAMRLAMEVLRSASDIVMRTAQPAATSVAAPVDDFDRQLKAAMINRLLNPPDPFEMFVRFKTLMGDTGGAGGPMMEKILGAAVDKILNPAPAITGRTTLLDIGREFIPVLGTVMHEYRLSREADARITEIQRSAIPPPQPVHHVQPNPPATVTQLPAVAPPAPQPPPPPATPALTFPQIESHIAKIVSNAEFSTDEAVDKVIEFLYDTDARLVPALLNPPSIDPRLKPGKDGLMQLFSVEPPLKPCLTNPPRLSEFLDKFIVAATEAEAAEARLRAAAPAQPA